MSGADPSALESQYTQPDSEPTSADGSGSEPEVTGQRPARDARQVAIEEVVRPLAIAAMLTCIGVAIAQLMQLFAPTWPGTTFSVLVSAVSLESIHSGRLLARVRMDSKDRFRFRFVEWVVIILLVRFSGYLELGSDALVRDLAAWSTNMGRFFDIGFIVNALLIAAFWSVALVLSRTLQELEASPLEMPSSVTDPGHYLRSTMPQHGRVDRRARLSRITGIYYAGGVLTLLLAAIVRVDAGELVHLEHARTSGIIQNVLIYFLIGFLLISEARYTILKANWELQSIPVLGNMGRRWLLLVVGFLLLVGIISAVLPVGYSVGILETVGLVTRWVIYALVQIAFFVLFAISYLIGLVLSLFTGKSAGSAAMERPPMVPPPAPVVSGGNPWWQLIRSLVFWTILMGIMGYSIFHFFAFRLGLLQDVRLQRILDWFRRLWAGIRSTAGRATSDMRKLLSERLASRRARMAPRRMRYVSLRNLSPRDRVRYYYLSVLHRTAQQGLGRSPAATPLEYRETLTGALSDVTDQVGELTEAFVEARYSAHTIGEDDSSRVKSIWRQVRRALALHKRRGSESS